MSLNPDWSLHKTLWLFTDTNWYTINIKNISIDNDKITIAGPFKKHYDTLWNEYDVDSIITLNTGWNIESQFGLINYADINDLVNLDNWKKILWWAFTQYNWQTRNRIVLVNSDWSIDSSFNIWSGFNWIVRRIQKDNDWKFIVWGDFTNYNWTSVNRIIRLNNDWTIDNSFDVWSGFNWSVGTIIQDSDWNFIIWWSFTSYKWEWANRIIKIDNNWNKDNSLVIWWWFNWSVYNTFLTNGSIIVRWNFSSYKWTPVNRLAKLHLDASIDNDFNIINNTSIGTIYDEWNWYFILWWWFNNISDQIARINQNWEEDQNFTISWFFYRAYTSEYWGPREDFENIIYNIVKDNSWRIIVWWYFNRYYFDWEQINIWNILAFNPDWSRDNSFKNFNNYVTRIKIDNNNKFLVWWEFTEYNWSSTNAGRLIRLNPDWSRDTSFGIGAGFNGIVRAIVMDSNEKILVWWEFTTYNWNTQNRLIRLNSDWSKDTNFDIWSWFNNTVRSIYIDSNWKILVWWSFTSYSWSTQNRLIRLNSDWSKDTSFNIWSWFNNTVWSVISNTNNKIYVAWDFTFYNNQPATYLLALWAPVTIPNSTDINTVQSEFTSKGYSLNSNELIWSNSIYLSQTNWLIPTQITLNNNDIKLTLPANLQFKKNDWTTNYSWAIVPPTPTNVTSINNIPVLSAVKVGSNSEPLKLAWWSATLTIPVPGKIPGDKVTIFSSQNKYDWTKVWLNTLVSCDAWTCAVLDTDHFSYFAVGDFTWSFFINNDATSTTTQNVTLNIDVPTATQMRFRNEEWTWTTWEAYTTSKSWTLSNGTWTKTVNVEFNTSSWIISDSDTIEYTDWSSENWTQWNITLTITWWVTECVYWTSLDMNAQDVKIGIPYTFSWTFPSAWYCQDYSGIRSGWTLTIQTTNLSNEKWNVISGSNLLISHDPVVVEGDLACTGYNGAPTQFYTAPYEIFEKASGIEKICKVSADNVWLLINVPANQAPGNYSGTLTLTMNGF
jgi:hypothetical protein